MVEYLSHYTNVDSLEKILETQTFKFSRLTELNDCNEGKNLSGFKTEYMMYSSSWCEDISEVGINYMWEKYANDNSGVRIIAPKHIFQRYDYIDDNYKSVRTYLPKEYYKEFVPNTLDKFLWKMQYTDELDKIIPNIKYNDKHWEAYKIQELSKYKEVRWQEEYEWRYGLSMIHRGLFKVPKNYRNLAIQIVYPKSIFLKFKSSMYKKMTIYLGKNISESDRNKIYELVMKYKFKVATNLRSLD